MPFVQVRQDFDIVECASCCMAFAVPARFVQDRRADHQTFYCPRGHWNHYSQKTEAEILREELESAKVEQRRLLEAGCRLSKRVLNGVCPCCNRHFANVQRHIRSKHRKEVKLIA